MVNKDMSVTEAQEDGKLNGFIRAIPQNQRSIYITLVNAYIDGMTAGEAIASRERSRQEGRT